MKNKIYVNKIYVKKSYLFLLSISYSNIKILISVNLHHYSLELQANFINRYLKKNTSK